MASCRTGRGVLLVEPESATQPGLSEPCRGHRPSPGGAQGNRVAGRGPQVLRSGPQVRQGGLVCDQTEASPASDADLKRQTAGPHVRSRPGWPSPRVTNEPPDYCLYPGAGPDRPDGQTATPEKRGGRRHRLFHDPQDARNGLGYVLRPQLSANWWTARARIINLAVFRAAPRRDSRSLLIVCVIGRKRTARVIGDHHGREVGTATVLLAATDPCWSG